MTTVTLGRCGKTTLCLNLFQKEGQEKRRNSELPNDKKRLVRLIPFYFLRCRGLAKRARRGMSFQGLGTHVKSPACKCSNPSCRSISKRQSVNPETITLTHSNKGTTRKSPGSSPECSPRHTHGLCTSPRRTTPVPEGGLHKGPGKHHVCELGQEERNCLPNLPYFTHSSM